MPAEGTVVESCLSTVDSADTTLVLVLRVAFRRYWTQQFTQSSDYKSIWAFKCVVGYRQLVA